MDREEPIEDGDMIESDDAIQDMSDAEDGDGDVHQEPTTSILDLVVDGKATEARDAIYATLYQKVGEKIDSMRSELRSGSETSETPTTEEPQKEE